MKKFFKIFALLIIILVSVVCVYSSFAINKPAKVHYIKTLPGKMLATTTPPFGIFIKEKYRDEGDGPKTILAHERIHWLQYQELGLSTFYLKYLGGWLKHGRLYNDLERDARHRSSPEYMLR